MPVAAARTSAISSSFTSATASMPPAVHCFSPGIPLAGQLLLGVAQRGGLLEVPGVDRGLLLPPHAGDLLVVLAQGRRRGHPADPHPRAGLIDQVDRLIRQEP